MEIQTSLSTMSYSSPSKFHLPLPQVNLPSFLQENQKQTPAQLRQFVVESIEKFKLDQKQVFNEVLNSVLQKVSTDDLDVQPATTILPAQRFFLL